jgi:vacuolar iron transporter family protein
MPSLAHTHNNPKYIHHKHPKIGRTIREVVFGLEDGMVSTLGSVTGIAAATRDPAITLIAGCVIIGVESISMAVGSYLSSKSKQSVDELKLAEESEELTTYPEEEKEELIEMYVKDGWSKKLAVKMTEEASQNHALFLKEMALRELKVFPDEADKENPLKNGLLMGVSYVLGGIVPLVPYLAFGLSIAVVVSICFTLCALFVLGAVTTKYSLRKWWKAGFEMFALAGLAAAVGYAVGQVVEMLVR